MKNLFAKRYATNQPSGSGRAGDFMSVGYGR